MGRFAKHVQEYTFVSLEEMICDIVKEIEDCKSGISIVASCMEIPAILTALISTGKYGIDLLDWSLPEMDGYGYEYTITITNFDGDYRLYCEKAYNENLEDYYKSDVELNDVYFISQDVSEMLYNKRVEEGHNVVLYDIEA